MDHTNNFSLKWNNHQANITSIFDQVLSTTEFSDVTITCDYMSLKAHKMVLSSYSPYFKSLLLQNPCQHSMVMMKGVKFSKMKALIDIMYRGEVVVSHDELNELFETAKMLKIRGISAIPEEEHFRLKWNKDKVNIIAIFEELLSTEMFADMTIACDGLSLKAHKMVLSACSPYFQSLLLGSQCELPIVFIKDVKYRDLKAIINFMYRGEVNVSSQDHLKGILKTANLLKVKGLAHVYDENISTGVVQQEVLQDTQEHSNSTLTPIRPSTGANFSMLGNKRKIVVPKKRPRSESNSCDNELVPPAKIKESRTPAIEEITLDLSLGASTSEYLQTSASSTTCNGHQPAMVCIAKAPPSEDRNFEIEPSKPMEKTLPTDMAHRIKRGVSNEEETMKTKGMSSSSRRSHSRPKLVEIINTLKERLVYPAEKKASCSP